MGRGSRRHLAIPLRALSDARPTPVVEPVRAPSDALMAPAPQRVAGLVDELIFVALTAQRERPLDGGPAGVVFLQLAGELGDAHWLELPVVPVREEHGGIVDFGGNLVV